MRRLPWLTETQRKTVDLRIERVIIKELAGRHWGTTARGVSPGQVPRLYVIDIRGLLLAAGVLRYTLMKHDTTVFYRGQRRDWEARVSIYRGARTRDERNLRAKWLNDALACIAPVFDIRGTDDERESLAQHYGLPTRWLDVVDNVSTAAWFAYHDSAGGSSSAGRRDDAVGYITALASPRATNRYVRYYDLRNKPSEWLRPHIQQAWSLRSEHPDVGLGNLYYLPVATFIVPRPLLRLWSGYDVLTPEIMFPNSAEDSGVYYWQQARETLENVKLWPPPWAAGP